MNKPPTKPGWFSSRMPFLLFFPPFLRVLEQRGGPFFIAAFFIIPGYPSLNGDSLLYFEIIVQPIPDIAVTRTRVMIIPPEEAFYAWENPGARGWQDS